MLKNKWMGSLALLALVVGGFVAVQTLTGTVSAGPGGGSGCEGDVKIDGGVSEGNHVYNAPADESITSVCIKAGRSSFVATCGNDDSGPAGCFDVTWTLGAEGCCTSVEIGGGGTGRDCKAISHSAAQFGGEPCDVCVPAPEVCDNGSDDDCDGLVDCEDPDCVQDPVCNECVPEEEKCAGGVDEDCDGLIDCADPDCFTNNLCKPEE